MTLRHALLDSRGIIALGGDEAKTWLQGLISNDVRKVAPDRAIYAALLTPQGKFLHDFIIVEQDGRLLLDTEVARLADLKKRLGFYRLRSKVTIEDVSGQFAVAAVAGEGAPASFGLGGEIGQSTTVAGAMAFVDPRHAALGVRLIGPKDGLLRVLAERGVEPGLDYEAHRLAFGVPDGSRDMPPDDAFLLESNFEELNGVDFDKGCYVGQETTTRTKRRGTVRRRLMRVISESVLPSAGTPIFLGEREAGEMRSSQGAQGLALMRLELVEEAAASGLGLVAEGQTVKAHRVFVASRDKTT